MHLDHLDTSENLNHDLVDTNWWIINERVVNENCSIWRYKVCEIQELKTFEHFFFSCNWVFETWLSFHNFHWQA